MDAARDDVEAMRALRHELHAQPELSGEEATTAARVRDFLVPLAPDTLWTGVGGHGVVAIFNGPRPGPTVALRAELDALPICEEGVERPHRSQRPGVAHSCGHDGHTATLAGVARRIRREGLPAGRVALVFQPAEESGEGARAMLADPRWAELRLDRMFAFHNLPRFPRGTVVVREGVFACASVGLQVRLRGSGTHSSYPEHGRSPARAVAEIITALGGLVPGPLNPSDLTLVTVTQAQVGEPAQKIDFGVAPSTGLVVAVLRAARADRLRELRAEAWQQVHAIAERHELAIECLWQEAFTATVNDTTAVSEVVAAAAAAGLPVQTVSVPFRWSEDVGLFLESVPGALFGLGAGEEQPQLHNEAYDYPDDLLPRGLDLWWSLIQRLLQPPASG